MRTRFLLSGCVLLAVVVATTASGQVRRDTRERLASHARRRGRVRVLVKVRTEGGFVHEGRLSTQGARRRQRAAIGRAQRELMDALALSNARLRVSFRSVPYIAVEVDEEGLDELAASELVELIVEDSLAAPTLASTISLVGAAAVWSQGVEGAGHAVAILDTGVEAGHTFFGGRVVSEACYSTSSAVYASTSLCPNNQGAMLGPSAASPAKCSGVSGCDHGTHVAGIAAGSGASFHGVARQADIIAIQVFSRFNDSGTCGGPSSCLLSFSSDQLAGLERIYELRNTFNIASANLSLGGGFHASTCDGVNPAYTDIVETLRAAGIATVIASGNSSFTSGTSFPGCISSAVTTGMVWDDDTVASFSNSAPWVDLLAPGGAVQSSITGGGFGIKSGTSMAAPHVAGAFALLRSGNPTASIAEIQDALVSTGIPIIDGKSGIETSRIRVDLAADVLVPAVPPPVIVTALLPKATLGLAFAQPIAVTGGAPPLLFSITAGAPAAGLNLDPDTGMVDGVPASAGTFAFTVEVTDALSRSDFQNVTHVVELPRPVALSPSGSIAIARPTFGWTTESGATSYNLVVENQTDGVTAIDVIVAASTFTPASDLPSGKLYAWRVRGLDGSGNASAFTDNLLFDIDTTAPAAAPLDVASPIDYTPLAVISAQGSADVPPDWSVDKAFDGDTQTAWSTPGSTVLQEEYLLAELGSPQTVGRVRLVSRFVTGALFPEDFEIQLSSDGVTFITVVDVAGFTAAAGTSYDFTFGASVATHVRLRVTRVRPYFGMFYTQLAEMLVDEPHQTPRALQIRWSAPGDDGLTGTASSYDLRWSFAPIDDTNFLSASAVPGTPVPSPVGTLESVLFDNLSHETRYYVALRSADDVGNPSVLDTTDALTAGAPPAPINDLAAVTLGPDAVTLSWTASGEDGASGTADHYEVRYSSSPITAELLATASLVTTNVPAPAASGVPETMTVDGLAPTSAYYFGIRVFDAAGNASALSNVVRRETQDVSPPAKVSLSVAPGGGDPTLVSGVVAVGASSETPPTYGKDRTTDGDFGSSWSSLPRATLGSEHIDWSVGGNRAITRVRLRSREETGVLFPEDYEIQLSSDAASWVSIASASGTSVSAGEWVSHDFPAVDASFVRLLVTKPARYTGNGHYYVQMSEVEIYASPTTGIAATLDWIAPGDDGSVGTAVQYSLCYSENEGDVDAFCTSSGTVLSFPVTGSSGTSETRVVTALNGETRYYFSLRTADDATPVNLSPPSDTVYVDTPGVAPAPITDLSVLQRGVTEIELRWQSSGDDGTSGMADEYHLCYATVPFDGSSFCPGTVETFAVGAQFPSEESYLVQNLQGDTTYYIGLLVEDELDNGSPLSNVLTVTALDVIPPDPATQFTASAGGVTLGEVPVAALAVSQEVAGWGKAEAVDGNPATAWSTLGSSTPDEHFLVLDAGSVQLLGRVRLLSRDVFGDLFPVDFAIQTATVNEEASYQTQVAVTGFSTGAGTWSSFAFPSPVSAQFVRLKVTLPALYAPTNTYWVQVAEMAVDEATVNSDEMSLTWKASGDDGNVGTATTYQLCYSETENDVVVDFCQSTGTLVALPVTGPLGTDESHVVSGLSGETRYYFGLKVLDEDSNPSLAVFDDELTPVVPPSPATNFRVTGTTTTTVSLGWEATGDDGTQGIADHYDLCVSSSPIDADNFCAGTLIQRPVTGGVGTAESHTVGSLTEDTDYYFGIRVVDLAGGMSTLTAITGKTSDGTPPEQAPMFSAELGVVQQVAASALVAVSSELPPSFGAAQALDGNPATSWSTPGQPTPQEELLVVSLGSPRTVLGVRLLSRDVTGTLFPEDFLIQTSLVNSDGSYVTQASGTSFVATAGTWYEFTFAAPVTAEFIRLKVTKTRQYVNGTYWVQLAELEVQEELIQSDKLTVKWKAPHENGASGGPASEYILRRDTSPVSSPTDGQEVPLGTPALPGTDESVLVDGLAPATTYHFGLWSKDENGNLSPRAFDSATTGS